MKEQRLLNDVRKEATRFNNQILILREEGSGELNRPGDLVLKESWEQAHLEDLKTPRQQYEEAAKELGS